jgi:hypothetical protein
MAAYRRYIERMYTLPISAHHRQREWKYIKQLARNNNVPMSFLTGLKCKIQQKPAIPPTPAKKDIKKWASLTFFSPQIREVTNIFKNTNLRISFKSCNTLQQILNPPSRPNTFPLDRSGVYSLTCNTCNLKDIGQISQKLRLRYREHVRYIRNNNPQSAYALHILQNRHKYGPIESTMHLLKPISKSSLLLPCKQLYILNQSQKGILIPEQYASDTNPLVRLAASPTINPV